jgi:hypothetical protein
METTTTPPLYVNDAELYQRLAYELRRLAAVATGHTHSIHVELWLDSGTVRANLLWGGSVHTGLSGCRTASGNSLSTVFDALEDKDTELTDRIDDLRQRANAMLAEAAELEANA